MKKATKVVILIATMLAISYPDVTAQTRSVQGIPIPPLHPFTPQQPRRIELLNGMVVLLAENHELPLIEGIALVRGGSHDEPAIKTGLVDIYGEVWRTGGTSTKTGDQLDDFLEARAAKVETKSLSDATSITLSCLKDDFDKVFEIFIDVLQNPEFRPDKLEIARKRKYDTISRYNDRIEQIAEREAAKLAFGADNPYARSPENATVAAVTRMDLVAWHNMYVHPNNIILGISGDFDAGAMESKLRKVFESWPKGPSLPEDQVQYHSASPGYYFISKGDVNQSRILIVGLGIQRNNPDYCAVKVFNEAFGGGFSSRLFNDIRTKRGLAYGVSGAVGSNFGHLGILQIMLATGSHTTVEALRAVTEDIDNVTRHPITDDEVKQAKDSILNSLIFQLDSPNKILSERMTYEFYRYPADWLTNYESHIRKVTTADVNRVATKYLHRDQLAVLVVGDSKNFDEPLSTLGSVKEIRNTSPSQPGAHN
jgi:zinc protease